MSDPTAAFVGVCPYSECCTIRWPYTMLVSRGIPSCIRTFSLHVEHQAINDSYLPTLTFPHAVYTVQTQLSTLLILLTPRSASWQSPFNSVAIYSYHWSRPPTFTCCVVLVLVEPLLRPWQTRTDIFCEQATYDDTSTECSSWHLAATQQHETRRRSPDTR